MSDIKYVALIRKEENTDYWVDIPDLPGCVSWGETEDEAMTKFQDALELHLEGMKEENLPLPPPRSKDDILSSEEDPYLSAYIIEVAA